MPIYIADSAAAEPEGWKRVTLTDADSSQDTNSVVTSATDDGTKTTVTIDMDQAAPRFDPNECAIWFYDTDLLAQDVFSLDWRFEIQNYVNVQNNDMLIYAGITSNIADDSKYFGGGMDFQNLNPRGLRQAGATTNRGGGTGTTRGIACNLLRGAGTVSGNGNVASNVWMQMLDSSFDPLQSYYDLSQVSVDAAAGTDGIKFFVAVGLSVTAVATTYDLEFKLWRSPLIKRV